MDTVLGHLYLAASRAALGQGDKAQLRQRAKSTIVSASFGLSASARSNSAIARQCWLWYMQLPANA
jgi:hypothetical protein